jgi:hypothetical protein
MLDWKRKLALIAVPAVLALGGASAVAFAAAPASRPSATQTQTTQAAPATRPDAAGQPETGPEQVEANEPNLPDGGHTDAGAQADHQFDGAE